MSGLRSLLRLDDKVAGEGRRLALLGGPPRRWLTPFTLFAAAVLHAAILLLPVVKTKATFPQVSAVPDFPLVWRPAARVPPPPPPGPAAPELPAAAGETAAREVDSDPLAASLPSRPIRLLTFEPVPEPDPVITLTRMAPEVEALLPPPDALPPSLEVGPASGAATQDQGSALIERVEPAYPIAARALGASGQVTLRIAVLPNGTIAGAVVTACSRPGVGFEAAALAAVKKWRYAPAPEQLGSRDVEVTVYFKTPGRP